MNIKASELNDYVGKNIQVELTKVREGRTGLTVWWDNKILPGILTEVNQRKVDDSDSGWLSIETTKGNIKCKFDQLNSITSI